MEENKNAVKKMRVQLLDDEGRIISDKLVTQDPFMYAGPTDKHVGPMKIEFTFLDKGDVDKVCKFLSQLTGDLPLSVKSTKSSNTTKVELDENKREELIGELTTKSDQDEAISYLRDLGFVFLYQKDLSTFKIDFEPKKAHNNKYQWMVRKLKESKVSPLSDKYDPTIIIGMKIDDTIDRSEKVVIYLYGKFHAKASILIPTDPQQTYNQTSLIKYPKFMTYDERIKFSTEHRGLTNGGRKAPSKFYMRWMGYVIIPEDEKNDFEKDAGNEADKNNI